jgi:DNA repair photolyase
MNNFDTPRTGTGTNEWAEETYSFEVGCEVGCHYCWALEGMLRRKVISKPSEWLTPRTNVKKIEKGWRKHDGVIMFPGTHNIGMRNLENSIEILTNVVC